MKLISKAKQNNFKLGFISILSSINPIKKINTENNENKKQFNSFSNTTPIVNLSIGGTREFVIHEKKKDNKIRLNLKDNSLLIMAGGSQKFYQHEIPKNDSKMIRYSLTFREHLG